MAKIDQTSERKIDQVQQVLERGRFFIKWSKKYLDLYEEKKAQNSEFYKSENVGVIVLQNVLYANEGLLLLQTLFSENKQEASFRSIISINPAAKSEYETLRNAYWQTPLKDFRDKIVAHKDRKNIGDPLIAHANPIMEEWLEKAESFYVSLNGLLHKYFDPITNDVHESFYKKPFEYLYKKLEEND